jgi:hypothetical protein
MMYLWTRLRVSFNTYISILVAIQVIYRALSRQLTTRWYFIIAWWPKWIGLGDSTVFSWAGCHRSCFSHRLTLFFQWLRYLKPLWEHHFRPTITEVTTACRIKTSSTMVPLYLAVNTLTLRTSSPAAHGPNKPPFTLPQAYTSLKSGTSKEGVTPMAPLSLIQ